MYKSATFDYYFSFYKTCTGEHCQVLECELLHFVQKIDILAHYMLVCHFAPIYERSLDIVISLRHIMYLHILD